MSIQSNPTALAPIAGELNLLGWGPTELPNLALARTTTETAVGNARTFLATAELDECVDVIGLGSIGRFEMSLASDLDYLIVCHANDGHNHDDVIPLVDSLRCEVLPGVELRKPGSTGLFGGALDDADLYDKIGLEKDSNTTHSRRVLVLEESISMHNPSLHSGLMQRMVSRYINAIPFGRSIVPRFLMNDLARYWRQLAVDYQAKTDTGGPSSLRRLKLIVPRKFTYAASVLPLLTLELRGVSRADLDETLVQAFAISPTLRFANEIEYLSNSGDNSSVTDLGRKALRILDKCCGLLADSAFRERIEAMPVDAGNVSIELKAANDMARELQDVLEELFFSDILRDLTRKFLVF